MIYRSSTRNTRIVETWPPCRRSWVSTSLRFVRIVVSKISVFGETNSTHRRSTPLPGGTADVTSLKRATAETLSFRPPRLRFLQKRISERKGWKNNLFRRCSKQHKMTSYYGIADTQDAKLRGLPRNPRECIIFSWIVFLHEL